MAPGKMLAEILPVSCWMVEGLHKSPRGKCVLVRRCLVEVSRGKEDIKRFNPLEEDVTLIKNTFSFGTSQGRPRKWVWDET